MVHESLDEAVDAYCTKKRYFHFEGDSGCEKLENLLSDMGYEGHGLRWGTPIESFLSDNPGAMEALLTWVREQDISEWQSALEESLED
jgi:hypothetical protein